MVTLDWQRNFAREKHERDLAEEMRNIDLEMEKTREKKKKRGI